MPGHAHGNGEVDLDEDGTPEIIILDAEKLIILKNNGYLKTTITLP